jgi:formamidopyrimidine-DNA glycosylase
MPELPDIEAYLSALRKRVLGQEVLEIRAFNPFVLRTFDPPLKDLEGRRVEGLRRLGKRIVVEFEGEMFLVIHLMIAGRLSWSGEGGARPRMQPRGRLVLARLRFAPGVLTLTEASTKKRASLHAVRGRPGLAAHDPGGIEPLEASLEEFAQALTRENRTLKRALTNPRAFAGIGNAYSDEILHAARLSPVRLTSSMSPEETDRLFRAMRSTLTHWRDELICKFEESFPGPGDVTAFREGFAVHGRYGLPCPDCGAPVQRIRYSENETDYCARCQNEGRLLADRSLSRLLKADWPRTLEELMGE